MLPGFETLDLESLAPPCTALKNPWDRTENAEKCDQVAEWFTVRACCGHVALRCTSHKEWWSAWYAKGRTSHCVACDSWKCRELYVERL